MAQKKYSAKINLKTGGTPICIEVEANDTPQAKKIIELRPEFKSFVILPQLKK